MPNLICVRSVRACPHIGEVVTPGVSFLSFFVKLYIEKNISTQSVCVYCAQIVSLGMVS